MMVSFAVILVMLSSVATPAPPNVEADFEAYWTASWNCGQAAEQFNVSIAVGDVEAVFRKVDAAMVAAGASSQRGVGNIVRIDHHKGPTRAGQYSLPINLGEKMAKKMWELGDLTKYSVNRPKMEDATKSIEERIGILERELTDNFGVLSGMPTARFFLTSKLSALRKSLATCGEWAKRSTVLVNVHGEFPSTPR